VTAPARIRWTSIGSVDWIGVANRQILPGLRRLHAEGVDRGRLFPRTFAWGVASDGCSILLAPRPLRSEMLPRQPEAGANGYASLVNAEGGDPESPTQ